MPGVYLVFEGGGAKGLAHLGAYKAVEEYFEARRQFDEPPPTGPAFQVLGAAGTSVGAIMATLIAAGYTADELYKIPDAQPAYEDKTSLFRVDWSSLFFDPREWKSLKKITAAIQPLLLVELEWLRVCATFLLVGGVVAALQGPRPVVWFLGVLGLLLLAPVVWIFWVWWQHRRAIRSIWMRHGLMGTQSFHAWIEDRLREKLNPVDQQIHKIRFVDLPVSVQMISADLSNRKLSVLGGSVNKQASVTESVVDSMTIPIIFQPRTLGISHVDGGIVANCPDWIFDTEYKSDGAFPLTPTLVFRLGDGEKQTQTDRGRLGYLENLFLTAVFGEKTPERQLPPGREHTVRLPTPKSFLDFDLSEIQKDQFFKEARLATYKYLANPQPFWPAESWRVERALQLVLSIVEQLILKTRDADEGAHLHLRANVMFPLSKDELGIVYSVNMLNDYDLAPVLKFKKGAGCCGLCWEQLLVVVGDMTSPNVQSNYQLKNWQQRLVRPSLISVLSLPLVDFRKMEAKTLPERFIGVLSLDSDDITAMEFSYLINVSPELVELMSSLVLRTLLPVIPPLE